MYAFPSFELMALTKAGGSAQIEGLSSALARPNFFFHGLSLRIKHSGIFCVPPPPPALPVIYPSIHLVSPLSWLRVRARASLPIHCYIGRPRVVLTLCRAEKAMFQGNQIQSNTQWTLRIQKMFMGHPGYNF